MLEFNISISKDTFALKLNTRTWQQASGIFGPSGSGKSTFLKCIAGLEPAVKGLIRFRDETWLDSQQGQNLRTDKRKLGLMFQDSLLFPHLNTRSNLEFGLARFPKADKTRKRDEVIHALELEPLLEKECLKLSGGEKRRIALGRTLLCNPRLLLLDEPFTGLHLSLKKNLLRALDKIRKSWDIEIIQVSHDLEDLLELSDQLLLISNGKILSQGSFPAILSDPVAEKIIYPAVANAPKCLSPD